MKNGKQELISATYKPPVGITATQEGKEVKQFADLFEADIFDMEKALEYLNRSAHAGNESAAIALTRMANNQFLAVATNVLDLVGSLASIESYRQPQDCTTIPIGRKERKKHEREQSM